MRTPRISANLRSLAALLLCGLLPGCGGGGNSQIADGGVGGTAGGGGKGTGGGGGVGGTGVVALGTLAQAQAGQIVVNSTAFATTASTQVRIDDNTTTPAALRDGMFVLVEGYKDTATQETEAEKVVYRSNVRGPVESVSEDCKSAVVLGQPVSVTANTRPAFADGACDLTIGELVDVSGLVSDAPSNTIVASFIRRMATPSELQVMGAVASSREHEFTVGKLSVDYEHARLTPPAGVVTRESTVLVKGHSGDPGQLIATEVEIVTAGIAAAAGHEAHIEGYISNLSGTSFKVNGQSVDTASAVLDPTSLVLANGLRVEIEGRLNGQGVLVATHLELKVEEGHD